MPEMKSQQELDVYIGKLESDMREAAKRFEFEKAAKLRTGSGSSEPRNFCLREIAQGETEQVQNHNYKVVGSGITCKFMVSAKCEQC